MVCAYCDKATLLLLASNLPYIVGEVSVETTIANALTKQFVVASKRIS